MMEDIRTHRYQDGEPKLRRFHQAKWDEPIIFELSTPGERGILVPELEADVREAVGDPLEDIPEGMRRATPPALPEMAQPRVLRHYMRLSQETLGADLNIEIGQGTCTMKYNPKVNEDLARSPEVTALHPRQPVDTVQGMLEIMYRFEQDLKEISGLDRFTLQPGAGSQAIYTNAAIIRAYHAERGEDDVRDEIITTIFSHPSNAAAAETAGYKVITLYPEQSGYPSVDALRAAVSDRTAGLLITNPEDTGIFNPHIRDFVDIVHEAGGLCAYDQANANGILGVVRARESGFDLCHFNLHKTFSTPHGCGGPAVGACGVRAELAKYLPIPVVEFDGERYCLDFNRPHSIGKVRAFQGVAPVVLKAYAWVRSLGAAGLKEVAEIAVLNNNYLLNRMRGIRGVEAPYAEDQWRIEQVRYSWEQLHADTGVHSEELGLRSADFGVHYWTSHHPFIVPEPATLEPTETVSMSELDEYARIMRAVAQEAYSDPETVKSAPHNSTIHKVKHTPLDDPDQWAMTWRAYLKKTAVDAARSKGKAD